MTSRAGLAVAVVIAVAATACGGTETVTVTRTVTAPSETTTGLGPPSERVQFGHVETLTRKGDHFELRFDPAWFLSGESASRAAAEDGVVEPGQPVPNDNYVVEEGHRLLTYLVADDAQVTVRPKPATRRSWAPRRSPSPNWRRSSRARATSASSSPWRPACGSRSVWTPSARSSSSTGRRPAAQSPPYS